MGPRALVGEFGKRWRLIRLEMSMGTRALADRRASDARRWTADHAVVSLELSTEPEQLQWLGRAVAARAQTRDAAFTAYPSPATPQRHTR